MYILSVTDQINDRRHLATADALDFHHKAQQRMTYNILNGMHLMFGTVWWNLISGNNAKQKLFTPNHTNFYQKYCCSLAQDNLTLDVATNCHRCENNGRDLKTAVWGIPASKFSARHQEITSPEILAEVKVHSVRPGTDLPGGRPVGFLEVGRLKTSEIWRVL